MKLDNLPELPQSLNMNLNNDEVFGKIIVEEILSKVTSFKKNETYFEMLIGGMIEYYAIIQKNTCLYIAFPQKKCFGRTN